MVGALLATAAQAGLPSLNVLCHVTARDGSGQSVHEVMREGVRGGPGSPSTTPTLRVPLSLMVRMDGPPTSQPMNVLIGVVGPQGAVRYWAPPPPTPLPSVQAGPLAASLVAQPTLFGSRVMPGTLDAPLLAQDILPPNTSPLDLVLGPDDPAGLYRLFCVVASPVGSAVEALDPFRWWGLGVRWLLVRDGP
jgi:hypothetical protein